MMLYATGEGAVSPGVSAALAIIVIIAIALALALVIVIVVMSVRRRKRNGIIAVKHITIVEQVPVGHSVTINLWEPIIL